MVLGIDINKAVKIYKPEIIGEGYIDEFTGRKVRVKVAKNSQEVFLWKSVAIYEEVKSPKKLSKQIPVEEGVRPPWFSPLYSNWFIGDEIYQPFFGCGSVADTSLFVANDGAASFGTGRKEQQEILEKLRSAGNDRKAVLQILAEAKAKKISDVPDVESSIDVLAYLYGEVRRLGLDVHRFVHDYTYRPIATMKEILGSSDLSYEVTGKDTGKKLNLLTGTAGFHSTAIAPYGELLGLIDNPDAGLPRLNSKGKKTPIARGIDPRPGRRASVDAYLKDINAGSQSLGIGVPG